MDWGAFAKEYGLPMTMLIAFGFAIIKGYLVPGPTHEDAKKQRDRALDLVYQMAQGLKSVQTGKGDRGAQGSQGERGSQGEQGERGERGDYRR